MTKEATTAKRRPVMSSPEIIREPSIEKTSKPQSFLGRLAPWLLISGMILFHAINNWIWLSDNVTWTGWDKARHLARSLQVDQMLEPLSIHSLFEAIVVDPVRPPVFPMSASILYRLFGRTADIATMVNIVYMTIALVSVYNIGRRWGGQRVGMVAVGLLAVFPMFYAMSRYFYLEFALMAMVALAVWLSLETEGFERKGMSILFGLSLGLGLLTKRTFAIFVLGPLVVVILKSGLLSRAWARLKEKPRLYWVNALFALIGGLGIAALWYVPNRQTVQSLLLDDALFIIWWLLAALTIYFALLPSAPLANSLAALLLGASLASTWYLTRIEFLERVALYGYGVNDPRGRALQLDSLNTYLYYARKLVNEHLSLAIFLLGAVILVIALIVYVLRQGSLFKAVQRMKAESWVILTWLGGSYALLTFSIYQETRAFTPVLPAVALLFSAALFKLPWWRFRLAVLVLVLLVGIVQFSAVTFEPVSRVLTWQPFEVPGWGRTSVFAQGVYIQLPDEGQTDSGYWIQPDILRRMERRRQSTGAEMVSLGLLVNTTQINAGSFIYLMLTEYPHLRVESMIVRFDDIPPYRRMFAHEYLAVARNNESMNPSQEQTIAQILDNPPRLFAQTYEHEQTYTLPNGETVDLFRRRIPVSPDLPDTYATNLASDLNTRSQPGDAILLTPSALVVPFLPAYTGPADVYCVPDTEQELAEIAAQHRRVFLIQGDSGMGMAQDWLNVNGFRAAHEWVEGLQILTYGTVAGLPAVTPSVEVGGHLGNQIELFGYDLAGETWQQGEIVPVTLFWQRSVPIGMNYSVFVHLVDGTGRPVSQTDSAPVGGSRPTSGWKDGEILVDRHGLVLSSDIAPGEYALFVGIYLPETGERLQAVSADGQVLGDSVSLGSLTVGSSE